MWGAGRVQGHVDLFDVINSLQAKVEAGGADFAAELETLSAAQATEQARLTEQAAHEVESLRNLTEQLTAMTAA